MNMYIYIYIRGGPCWSVSCWSAACRVATCRVVPCCMGLRVERTVLSVLATVLAVLGHIRPEFAHPSVGYIYIHIYIYVCIIIGGLCPVLCAALTCGEAQQGLCAQGVDDNVVQRGPCGPQGIAPASLQDTQGTPGAWGIRGGFLVGTWRSQGVRGVPQRFLAFFSMVHLGLFARLQTSKNVTNKNNKYVQTNSKPILLGPEPLLLSPKPTIPEIPGGFPRYAGGNEALVIASA